ncbi:MAG: murein L,D-transpeptidase, partial [Gammaproteobacteria bacterium]
DAGTDAADALIELLRSADRRGLPAAAYAPAALAARLDGEPAPAARAQLELDLARRYLDYAGDVGQGRLDPAQAAQGWLIERRRFDPAQALASLAAEGVEETIETLEPERDEYDALLEARRQLAEQVAEGGWRPVRIDGALRPGDRHDAVPALRARLAASGDLPARDEEPVPADGPAASASPLYDPHTVAAVKRFQHRHGLEVDGIVGDAVRAALNVPAEQRLQQIDWNLERLRWLPREPGRRYVMVNLAGFRLQAFDADGERALQMPVIVGKAQHATPAFADSIEYLRLNPYWNVPESIVVNEIAPKQRENPNYLREKNMEIVAGGGATIDPASLDWARYASGADFPHRLRQRPGPQNALGRIKFMFPNRHAIYLHDTPADHLFDEAQRTFSHGCIRVEKPLALADWLLAGSPDWDGERVRDAIDAGDRSRIELPEPVPVYLYYLTAWVDEGSGRLHFREDIYDRDRELAALLQTARAAP